jgi:hypothetical protein
VKRIILHWTAGGHKANGVDLRHYHFVIEGDGTVVTGNQPVGANLRIENPSDGSTYAAHTRGLNTGSIGIALAGMRGAKERPFSAGPSPITHAQIDALGKLAARLAVQHRIPVTRETILTHAEVEPTLGVKQRGKWDITWLPGMPAAVIDPIRIGDMLRARITVEVDRLRVPVVDAVAKADAEVADDQPPVAPAWLRRVIGFFASRAQR